MSSPVGSWAVLKSSPVMTPSFSMRVGAQPAGFFSSPFGPSSGGTGGTVSERPMMSTTMTAASRLPMPNRTPPPSPNALSEGISATTRSPTLRPTIVSVRNGSTSSPSSSDCGSPS